MRISWILVTVMLCFTPGIAIAQEPHTVHTFLPLSLKNAKTIYVGLVLEATIPATKVEAVENAIMGDDYVTHDGKRFYRGWQGALSNLENQSDLAVPQKFSITESNYQSDQIIIRLGGDTDPDGYNGFTKPVIQENGSIAQSVITIHGINDLSISDISTITRHEIGHALGLEHSTDPHDLMSPIITDNPYISSCDLDGIQAVYNGHIKSQVPC